MSERYDHQMIQSTFEHALLHLYYQVSLQKGFVSEEKRNKILIDYLQPKVKQPRYKSIKKNLKTICLMKNKLGSIENHLYGLVEGYWKQRPNQKFLKKTALKITQNNEVEKLYALLVKFEEVGLQTKLIEETPTQEPDIVYLDRAHIDYCFDDNNRQVAPISLLIHTENVQRFIDCLTNQSYFKFACYEANEQANSYHYQLHPNRT